MLAAWRTAAAEKQPSGHRAFVALPEQQRLQAFCERLHRNKHPALENWNLLDASGAMVARTPLHDVIGQSFVDRDYFTGALRHLRQRGLAAVHVSTVYRSRADGLYKFDISAPVRDAEGGLLGVLAMSVTTGPDMGLAHLHDERHKALLLAPLEAPAASPTRPDPGRYVVLLHPGYAPGAQAIELNRSLTPAFLPRHCEDELSAATLDRAFARRLDYADGPAFTGPWLAGLAPVGNTGFVVVIQRPEP